MVQVRCPQCRELVEWKGNSFRPFCSERCKLIDLGQWANEGYSIKGEPADSDVLSSQDESEESRDNVIPFPPRKKL